MENQIPKGDVLKRLASDFNVDLNWLLTGEGEGPFKRPNPLPEGRPSLVPYDRKLGVRDPGRSWGEVVSETYENDELVIATYAPDEDREPLPLLLEAGLDQSLEQEFNELVITFIREILADPKGAKWFKRLFISNFPEFTDWLISLKLEK